MATRVLLHIGLPKTATTYLQTIMWGAREQMRAEGVLLPGAERRDHLWSSRLVRGERARGQHDPHAERAWDRLRAEISDWPGTALVSHEFFAAASAEQARRMVEQLSPAQVEVVITAREPLGLFAAGWQESLKNRETAPMPDFAREESDDPGAIWNWRTLDLGLVLQRWGDVVPADRVHVLALPGAHLPRETVWERFASLVGLDPAGYDATSGFANSSMGAVEAETLRRVNEHLVRRGLIGTALEKGTLLRTFLADERLVPRGGERYWPTPEQVEDCRRRGERAVRLVRERGFGVVGDLEDLLVPEELPQRRQADSVTDAEVADCATDTVAVLLSDVRDLRRKLHAARTATARAEARAGGGPGGRGVRSVVRRVARRVRRR